MRWGCVAHAMNSSNIDFRFQLSSRIYRHFVGAQTLSVIIGSGLQSRLDKEGLTSWPDKASEATFSWGWSSCYNVEY